jgi:glycosyltransferase involved in cell wall biosynthesis
VDALLLPLPARNDRTAQETPSPELLSGVSVVIPVYNSEESIGLVVEQVATQLDKRRVTHEFILVNDDSKDKSWAKIEQLARERANMRAINLMRNFGQHNALLCGIRKARYDTIVTMDDDLQHRPESVPKLLDALADGHDVVYGTAEEEPHGLLRGAASRLTKLALSTAMGAETASRVSAFRAFRTSLRVAFERYRGPTVHVDVLLTRFTHVVVPHEARRFGTSNYSLRKLITHALNMITGFSTLPLQLASIVGFAVTVFGLGLLTYTLVRYFVDSTAPPGFAFTASALAIFSGAQLFALGVFGEYLARVHLRLLDRPTYAVRTEVSKADVEEQAS